MVPFSGASIGSNIWLSRWTADPVFNGSTPANSSEFHHARNKYLGVYGGFGGVQGMFPNILADNKLSLCSRLALVHPHC